MSNGTKRAIPLATPVILVFLFSASAYGGSMPPLSVTLAAPGQGAHTLMMAAGSTAAAGGGAAWPEDAVTGAAYARPLSLEEAVAQALQDGPAMQAARWERDRDQLSWERGRDAADQIDETVLSNTVGWSFDAARAKHVGRRQAELTEALAGRKLRAAEFNARKQVEEAYYGVLKAEDAVRIAEANLDRARRQLAMARAQYAAGVKSRLDVLTAEKEAGQAEAGVSDARRGRTAAAMALNRLLGLPLDTPLRLTTRFVDPAAGIGTGPAGAAATGTGKSSAPAAGDGDGPPLAESIERALSRRPDLLALQDAVELARLTLDQAKKFYTPNVYAYRQAVLDLRGADLALAQKKVEVEMEVRRAHAVMRSAVDRIALLRQAVEQAREGFRVAGLMYGNGLSTYQDLANARLGLLQAETDLAEALYDYNLARSVFLVATAEGVD